MLKATLVSVFLATASPLLAQQGDITAADTNSDNKVDAAELKTYVSGKMADFDRFDELMTELDKDKDGAISSDEFAERMTAIQAIMQRPKPAAKPPAQAEWVEGFEKRFATRKPLLGETIAEDLAAFDGQGKEFRFAAARGKYTVVVFGCLT